MVLLILLDFPQTSILHESNPRPAPKWLMPHRLPVRLIKVERLHRSQHLFLPILFVYNVLLVGNGWVRLDHSFIKVLPFSFHIHEICNFFLSFDNFAFFTCHSRSSGRTPCTSCWHKSISLPRPKAWRGYTRGLSTILYARLLGVVEIFHNLHYLYIFIRVTISQYGWLLIINSWSNIHNTNFCNNFQKW